MIRTRTLEAALWAVALTCGIVLARNASEARVSATASSAFLQRQTTTPSTSPPQPTAHGDGAVIGRMEIPALHLSVPVMENYDPESLKRGVGHISGTAMPGGLGNLGLAGHRDTFFRPLRNVKLGMTINVHTAEGSYAYRIESTEIVTPDQVEVLDIRSKPELTLVTCYPFAYIGAAPKRFIVHARLLSLEPS